MERLGATDRKRVDVALLLLTENPRPSGAAVFKGLANAYRIRVGKCRIVYQVQDERLVIVVIAIGYRKDVYR